MDRGTTHGRSGAPTDAAVGAVVGRVDLLGELTALADDAVGGAGSLVVLAGEAGIGKTTLARALAGQVRDRLTVRWGRCVADGGAPPFWPWRAVLSPGSSAGSIADSAVGAQRFEHLSQLRDEVLTLGRRHPLLYVIEDLQWADVASVLLLGHLAAELADAPLMVLATFRTGETLPRPLEEAIEEVRRSARVRAVPPLREVEVAALIRSAGIDPDRELTALVRGRTGGNPLYVTELLRTVAAHDSADSLRAAVTASVPARVAEMVAHRLHRLPDAVSDLVGLASVVGTEGDAGTLAAALGRDIASVLGLLEQARAARLLDVATPGRWQFRHDLVRDTVYDCTSGLDRARYHAAVLEALAGDPTTPAAVLAHHGLAAQPLLAADRAVALAAAAGEAAFAQHAYEDAVAWFDRALGSAPLGTSARWRAELLVASGEAHRHLCDIEQARRAFRDAAELTDDRALLARAALGYADPGADLGIAYRSDDPVTAELLQRAIAAQRAGDTVTAALLEARLAAELYFSDEPDRASALAASALARARRLDDRRALGAAAAVIHDAFVVGQQSLDEQLRGSEQLLVWARADGSAAARLTAHRARVFDVLAAGDVVQMDGEILAFRRVAEPLKAPGYLWWLSLWSAMRAMLEGRHELAESRALAAFDLGQRPFFSLAFINLSFQLFFLRREQGRFEEMELPTREYAASHADIPALRVGLAFLLAETGRTDEARGMLDGFDERELIRLHDRNWPASWFQLSRAAFLTGAVPLAATLLEEGNRPTERCVTVSLATVCLGATDLATAWLLHTTGDLHGADERYAAATTTNVRIGARSWLAQARADHARLLLDRDGPGDRDTARRLVELAADAVETVGLPALAREVEATRLRLASAPASGSASGREPTRGAAAVAVFRRAGDLWEIEFAGRRAHIADSRGLRDLAHLLARPDQAVPAVELMAAPDVDGSTARGAPVLDARARREIRDRLRELDAAVDDAESAGDRERAALAREQRRLLAEAVARDLGLGGRSRLMGDPVERARKTVSTRIRRAVALIERSHPELGRHLHRSIDTGALCAYRPVEPIAWTT